MASILKPSKWFSSKGVKLRSRSSNSSSLCSPKSPMNYNKNEDDKGLREVFKYFDGDGDGKISAYELRSYFGSIGEHMSHEEAERVIQYIDTDGDELLDFNDFIKLMKGEEGMENDKDLRKAFEMFVWEEKEDCITPKGLQRMLQRLGDDRSYEECVVMIDAFDIDHNGVLDFNEFHQMMV
jgi:calcium-binding protein CML